MSCYCGNWLDIGVREREDHEKEVASSGASGDESEAAVELAPHTLTHEERKQVFLAAAAAVVD